MNQPQSCGESKLERSIGLEGEIVLMPSVAMLCNLLFYCRRGRAWPIRKLLVLIAKRRLLTLC